MITLLCIYWNLTEQYLLLMALVPTFVEMGLFNNWAISTLFEFEDSWYAFKKKPQQMSLFKTRFLKILHKIMHFFFCFQFSSTQQASHCLTLLLWCGHRQGDNLSKLYMNRIKYQWFVIPAVVLRLTSGLHWAIRCSIYIVLKLFFKRKKSAKEVRLFENHTVWSTLTDQKLFWSDNNWSESKASFKCREGYTILIIPTIISEACWLVYRPICWGSIAIGVHILEFFDELDLKGCNVCWICWKKASFLIKSFIRYRLMVFCKTWFRCFSLARHVHCYKS